MDDENNSFYNSQNFNSPQNFNSSQGYYPSFDNFPNADEYPSSFQNISQNSQEKVQTDTNASNTTQVWSEQEDIALMSAWCFVSTNAIVGTNQTGVKLWKDILNLYEQGRADTPGMGEPRTLESLRQRYKRLNANVTKWIAAYKKAHDRAGSGQSTEDIEKTAQQLYGKSKFTHHVVFERVMRHNPKWELKLNSTGSTRFHPDEDGRAPKVNYIVNGHEKNMGYYLTDGIYPQWAAFIKSIPGPITKKHQLFAQHQEAARKDVERAFGVLQARFAFIKRPCLIWDRDTMGKIMIACIIMHNMIVEDERNTYLNYRDPTEFKEDRLRQNNRQSEDGTESNDFVYSTNRIASLSSYMKNREQLRNREAHKALLDDLIEHIWRKFGNSN